MSITSVKGKNYRITYHYILPAAMTDELVHGKREQNRTEQNRVGESIFVAPKLDIYVESEITISLPPPLIVDLDLSARSVLNSSLRGESASHTRF